MCLSRGESALQSRNAENAVYRFTCVAAEELYRVKSKDMGEVIPEVDFIVAVLPDSDADKYLCKVLNGALLRLDTP
jgi:hypothetical protein